MKHAPLKIGDSIDIVAPGFRTEVEDVTRACQWIEKQGFVPRVPKDLYSPHFLHSAPDEIRLKHLKAAFMSPSKAIWCMRGGYGSNRLLPHLAKMAKPKKNKILLGLSDITSLETFVYGKWGWPSLHASILERFAKNEVPGHVESEVLAALKGEISTIEFNELNAMNKAAMKNLKIEAPLWGGNMVSLQSMIGTKFTPSLNKSSILFLEEIGERGYRVDRILEHMSQTGWLTKCKAIIFGDMLVAHEKDGRDLVTPAIERFAESLKIPVLGGLPSGHGDIQRPVPIGTKALLQIGKTTKLILDTGIKTQS